MRVWLPLSVTGALFLVGAQSTVAARAVLVLSLGGYAVWRLRPSRATGVLAMPFFTCAALILCVLPQRVGVPLMDKLLGRTAEVQS